MAAGGEAHGSPPAAAVAAAAVCNQNTAEGGGM